MSLIDRVNRRIERARKAERKADAFMEERKYRPEAEDAYQEAHDHMDSAIRLLEKQRLKLWNRSAKAGFHHYEQLA